MTTHASIIGIGSYLPERILTNAELETLVDTSDEWIRSRTGIVERRIVADDQATSDLAAAALTAALMKAGIAPNGIDLLIVGTSSPDMLFPSTACLVQNRLGMVCPAFDINAACSGFVYALQAGVSAIESGRAGRVAVVGADALTRIIDFTDRSTCVLFGDGAGAVILEATDEPGVLGIALGADGSGADLLKVPAGGSARPITRDALDARENFLTMNGSEVFRFAVKIIPRATNEALAASGLTVTDLDWLVPHQANQRIIQTVGQRLGIPSDRVFSRVDRVGNTSAASIPLALDDLYTSGQLAPGDLIALVGFGAGLTWGAGVVRWTMARPTKEA
ncbi:MAG: beta-ketoacyl-ACP synthase III [Anaerosomatales bacterium]|nr:ketoacyl-ACP synthase III [Anaerosomatales bacterium]MDT8433416.1 beta-ketoacyl-ACP synthase III [Anaerosomatales bacterium]